MVGETSCVLVLQNGWDVERDAAELVGAERVLGGCCFLCSNKIGPGHIHHLDYGRITFGEYAPLLSGSITKRMQTIAADFTSACIDIVPTEDLRQTRWAKLMWNIPFNGLSVVLNALTDRIMALPETASLAEALMREVQSIAAACGSAIPDSMITKLLDDTRKMVPYASSMLLDYQNRRPMEIEAIFGNPLRAAQAAKVSVRASRCCTSIGILPTSIAWPRGLRSTEAGISFTDTQAGLLVASGRMRSDMPAHRGRLSSGRLQI